MEADLEDSHCSATSGGTVQSVVSSGGAALPGGASALPPPSPPPPPTSVRDHHCPVHSLLSDGGQAADHSSSRPGSSLDSPATPPPPPLTISRGPEPATPRKSELLKSSTIRQHYYPEGGWGWLICACAFTIHLLTTGMQLAYGVLYLQVVQHYGTEYVIQAGWLGAFSMSVSHFLSPCVIAVCQRKSTRLTAVFGGLVMALACLFTSFAQQMHQTFVSYGLVLGLGVGMCRETANLMIGQYFKRRREAVEMIVQTGSGIGAAIFSVLFREAIGAVGWRLGLQVVTGVLFSSFILGMLYRSASLYHPQRRAILHLKYQKKKVKDKSGRNDKTPYLDFATLKTRTLQIIMVSTGISSLGVYAPVFYLALHCKEEGLDLNSIVILQTFLGFAFALGNVGFGLVVIRHNDQCFIARQYLVQASLCGLGMAILALATIKGYHSYVLFVWMYGLFLGGYHFSLKVYTYEKTRARHFTRAWGFVQWSKALPVLFGVPITGYINQGESSKVGFYFASAFTFVGASCLFLMNLRGQKLRKRDHTVTFSTIESRVIPPYVHSLDGAAIATNDSCIRAPPISRLDKTMSFATSVDPVDTHNRMSGGRLGDNDVTFDDDYYGCDCITSCDKVEHAFVFSEYENNLEEEREDNCGGGGANAWGGADEWGRGKREPITGAERRGRGGADEWGGGGEWGRGKREPITSEERLGRGGADEWSEGGEWGRGKREPIAVEKRRGRGGTDEWGGVSEWGSGRTEPIAEEEGESDVWGRSSERGRSNKEQVAEGVGGTNTGGGPDDWRRAKREPAVDGEHNGMLLEEDEEEVPEEEAMKRAPGAEVISPEVNEEAEDDAVSPLRTPRKGLGRGGRTPRGRRRASITVVEEMTTSV